MGEQVRLFDVVERTNPEPASWSEGSFRFLNRVQTRYWSRVRELLDDWFADYARCAAARKTADLKARFQSADPRQHQPAWWELYTFHLLRQHYPGATLAVEEHPTESATRPDFCVLDHGNPSLFVEAVAPFVGIATPEPHHAAEGFVLDTINAIESGEFCVMLGPLTAGKDFPKRGEIVRPITKWLAWLDHREVVGSYARRDPLPTLPLRVREWSVNIRALPRTKKSPGPRGLIVAGPVYGGFANDVAGVRSTLARKADHYGPLGRPFVIAAMPSTHSYDEESALGVLYGSEAVRFDAARPEETAQIVRKRDGLWVSAENVSAVILGSGISPWTVAKTWPQLWTNPSCAHPLPEQAFRIPRANVSEPTTVEWVAPDMSSPATLFGLGPDWPGPDPPFPRS